MFWSVGWPLLWAAGFFCNLDILYEGLGIGKLQFLIKNFFFFFQLLFFFNFWSLKPWIRIGPGSGSVLVSSLNLWIRIRIRKKWIRIRNTVLNISKSGGKFLLLNKNRYLTSNHWPIKITEASVLKQGFGSGSGSAWIRINLSCWIRIRIQEGKNEYRISMFWSAGCSLLRAEGFSCSLGVLYGSLGISKWQFLIKKIKIKFPAVNFFNFRSSNPGSGSGIRIRNPDPQLEKMLDPDPYPDPH